MPWKRKWQSFSVFLPGKSLGQRSLVGYSPWCHKSGTWLSEHERECVYVSATFSVCPSPSCIISTSPFSDAENLLRFYLQPYSHMTIFCLLLPGTSYSLSLPIFLRDFVLDICLVCSIQLNFLLWSNQCILKGVFSQLASSVAQSCPTLWPHGLQHARPPCPSPTPRGCSNSCPWSQWCHPTISSSVVLFCSCLQLLQHQGLFKWVSSLHHMAKVLEFQLQHQSLQWTFRIDFL